MELVIIWLVVGFVGGCLCGLVGYLRMGYITVEGVLVILLMTVFGPVALATGVAYLFGQLFGKRVWSFMDKKLFVRKGL